MQMLHWTLKNEYSIQTIVEPTKVPKEQIKTAINQHFHSIALFAESNAQLATSLSIMKTNSIFFFELAASVMTVVLFEQYDVFYIIGGSFDNRLSYDHFKLYSFSGNTNSFLNHVPFRKIYNCRLLCKLIRLCYY